MKYLILFLLPLTLIAQVDLKEEPKKSFFYASSGAYYAGPYIHGVDFGIGYRTRQGVSGFDIQLGGTWVDPVVPFIQGSYLVYPKENGGSYLGVGLSVVPYTGWGPFANLPLIAGYQTTSKKRPLFAQMQFSPFQVPGATFSVGVGF